MCPPTAEPRETFVRKSAILDDRCAKKGTDSTAIDRAVAADGNDLEEPEALVDAGVGQITVGMTGPDYDLGPVSELVAWRDGRRIGASEGLTWLRSELQRVPRGVTGGATSAENGLRDLAPGQDSSLNSSPRPSPSLSARLFAERAIDEAGASRFRNTCEADTSGVSSSGPAAAVGCRR